MVYLTSDDFAKVVSVTRKHLPLIEKKIITWYKTSTYLCIKRTKMAQIASSIEAVRMRDWIRITFRWNNDWFIESFEDQWHFLDWDPQLNETRFFENKMRDLRKYAKQDDIVHSQTCVYITNTWVQFLRSYFAWYRDFFCSGRLCQPKIANSKKPTEKIIHHRRIVRSQTALSIYQYAFRTNRSNIAKKKTSLL